MRKYLFIILCSLLCSQAVSAASFCAKIKGGTALAKVTGFTHILNVGQSLYCSLDGAGSPGPSLLVNKCGSLQHQIIAPATCADSVQLNSCVNAGCTDVIIPLALAGPVVASTVPTSRFVNLNNANRTCTVLVTLYCAP